MNNSLKTYLSISFSMIFWSFSFVWSKIAMETYEPVSIIFIRLIISSVMLFTILALLGQLQKPARSDIKYFLLLALFQPFLYFMGESFALKQVTATTASVIISTIPLFSPFAAYYFLKEKISITNGVGILLSIFGIYLVLAVNGFSIEASPAGIALLFLAVFSAVFYSIVLLKLANRYSSVSIIAYQNFIGIFYFMPLFFILDFQSFLQANHNSKAISSIVFLSVFASSLAYILYIYGQRRLGIVKSIIFVNMIPIFTVVFSFFFMGEEITLQKIIGIIIVVAGVMIAQSNYFSKSKK